MATQLRTVTISVKLRWWFNASNFCAKVFFYCAGRIANNDRLEILIDKYSKFIVSRGVVFEAKT